MKHHNILTKAFLLFLLFVGVQSVFAQIVNTPYVPAGYNLVFNDEFDNAATKLLNWKPDNRDGRGDEWLSTFGSIESGNMKLKNVKLPTPTTSGRAFTAPTCSSVQKFKFGYFECRYKYAASTGFNNSFWLLNAGSQCGKDYMEIDINEGQIDEGGQRNPAAYAAAGAKANWDHVRPLTLNHTRGGFSKAAYHYVDIDLSADYHTYGFLWTPDSLTYFFDGVKLLSHPNKRVINNEPVYRMLNYPMNVYLSSMNDPSIPGFATAVASSMDVDYVRVYQLPGSTEGLPPTTGANLLKNGGFGAYDNEDYGSAKYSWDIPVGNTDNLMYSVVIDALRTSPIYAPSQNINVLQTGIYELKFKARVVDATANTASLRMKISNSDNAGLSTVTAIAAYEGAGGVSGSEVIITKAHAPEMKSFTYRLKIGEPTALAEHTRVMFYSSNPNAGASFQIDDVELVKIDANSTTSIIKDDAFNLVFKNDYAPSDMDPCWSAYTNYSDGKFMSSKVTEGNNTFGRLQTTVANGEQYHYALSQFTNKTIAPGKYKISLRAKANVDGKKIALRIGTVSAMGTNLPTNLTNATSGVTLASNKIYFWPTTSWQEFSGVFDLNHPTADLLRINFLFPDVGIFDIDDVSIDPYSTSTGINEAKSVIGVIGGKGFISVSEEMSDMSVSVYSLTGMLIKQLSGAGLKEIPMQSGVYLVQVKKGNALFGTSKVVVL